MRDGIIQRGEDYQILSKQVVLICSYFKKQKKQLFEDYMVENLLGNKDVKSTFKPPDGLY